MKYALIASALSGLFTPALLWLQLPDWQERRRIFLNVPNWEGEAQIIYDRFCDVEDSVDEF